jgi:hypothetical protein
MPIRDMRELSKMLKRLNSLTKWENGFPWGDPVPRRDTEDRKNGIVYEPNHSSSRVGPMIEDATTSSGEPNQTTRVFNVQAKTIVDRFGNDVVDSQGNKIWFPVAFDLAAAIAIR